MSRWRCNKSEQESSAAGPWARRDGEPLRQGVQTDALPVQLRYRPIGAFPLGNKLCIALRELAQLLDLGLERLDVGIKG